MVKRYPVVSFVVLTYLITWPFHILGFIMADRAGMTLSNEDNFQHVINLLTLNLGADRLAAFLVYNLGQFGPVIAAFLITAIIYGRPGVADLTERVLRWRIAPRWYATVLLLPLALVVVSLAAAFLVDGFTLGPFTPKLSWLAFVPFVLFMIVVTGFAEEPGWRGFALPHLQATRSAYRASWILGVIWGFWHLPFTIYYNLAQPWALIPALIIGTIGVVGWTIVNTWVYNSAPSVFLIVVLHGWGNAVQSYLILSQPNLLTWTLYGLVPWAIAIALLRRYGNEHLATQPRPTWSPASGDGSEQRAEPGEAGRMALA